MTGLDATYQLADIKALVRSGRYYVTLSARQDALAIGFDYQAIRDCVLALDGGNFYKSMASERVPGLWQDVYRIYYGGVGVYLKLQICFIGEAVVISFKEDTGQSIAG